VGKDVYIQGLSLFMPNGWVKGTINAQGNQVVVKTGQFVGTLALEEGEANFYIVGQSEDSKTVNDVKDIVFDYNAERGVLTLNKKFLIQESLDPTVLNSYTGYWEALTLTKTEKETGVEAPAGLATQDYLFKASSVSLNSDGSVAGTTPEQFALKIGFDGNDVYVQGLCPDFPDAWVKGTLSDGLVTFANGQYFGRLPYSSIYLCGYQNNQVQDLVLYYDAATGQFSGESCYMLINSSKTEFNPYAYFAGLYFTKIVEQVATPANPAIVGYSPYSEKEGYGYIQINIPPVDTNGNGLVAEKLSYKVYQDIDGVQSPYVFKKAQYRDLPQAEMTEIPYTYYDNYDIFYGGSSIAFYEDSKSFSRVGVQSIYRGGGEERTSEIVWYDIASAGIELTTAGSQPVASSWLDLQGRPVSDGTKGLLLHRQRMADGTVRTTKVLRK
jgi:hypothetical protein